MSDSYTYRQAVWDAQYKRAWQEAPEEFKRKAAEAGITEGKVDGHSYALSPFPNHTSESYSVSMEEMLDTIVDALVEKYGTENERVVRGVYRDMQIPMQAEIERNRALALGRMLFYLVRSETRNIRAVVHAAMHAIPRLAAANGIKSMRESARICGVSPEWIRRSRDEVCDILQIPIPQESAKCVDAKKRYSENGRINHWRSQTTKKEPICHKKPIVKKSPNANSPTSTLLQEILRRSASRPTASKSETISRSTNGAMA